MRSLFEESGVVGSVRGEYIRVILMIHVNWPFRR